MPWLTCNGKVVGPVRVNVNTPGSSPVSDALGSVAAMVTTLGTPSAMVTVALFWAPITYVVGLAERSRITVSSPSMRASARGVMVSVVLACPAGMVTEKPIAW